MNPTLRGFIKKELLQTLRDPRMRFVLFLVPIVQLVLFGVALSTEIRNVRLGVAVAPDDVVATHVYQRALASGWFVPATTSVADPYGQISAGDADAVLVAPAGGFTRALGRGPGQLQLLVDASSAIRARSVERYMQQILQEVLHDEFPPPPGAASDGAPPLRLAVRVLYNPSMESAVFMVPGVMSMIVCVMTILLTSMALAREKELGTMEMLLAAPLRTWEVIGGKSIPYFLIGVFDIPLILLAAVLIFGVPVRGPLWALAIGSLAFVAATVGIGILISTLARNQQQAMMGGFMFLLPAVLLSGIMFPVDNMPLWLRSFVYINPLTYFAGLLRNVMLKGGSAGIVATDSMILLVIAAVMLALSFRRFRQGLS
jgi:ABC-2 type transport system permease protein